ncbi:armadillo-type protein [Haematococcus lacustris]
MVAFSEATHAAVISSGLVPQLVALCRCAPAGEAGESSLGTQLQQRAAAVLRNLAHNTRNHGLLINAGAVDTLVDIMRDEQHPAARINAAVAVACLVGHEESNPRLQLDEQLVVHMLQVLGAACQGVMKHEAFWTVWKLCQGLASLAVNDSNKELIARNGGVQVLAEVLFGKHHNNEAAHRYALSTLWNLAFVESSRAAILAQPGLVDAIRTALNTTESARTKEVAKGCLWTLGLEQDVKGLTSSAGEVASQCAEGQEACLLEEALPHVMLSYEWGCQQSVMLIKTELQAAGYKTWMDIDKMSGSTLEAMARAVEDSAAVVVCVSKRYKESQACRTEAEYAFQQRKKIIPVLLERDYKPSGWLGALMGTRLYFPMHDPRTIPRRVPALMKELGEAGRLPSNSSRSAGAGGGPSSNGSSASSMTNSPGVKLTLDRPESWSHVEVEEWLRRVRCADYVGVFREKDMDGLALSGLHRMSSDHRFTHNTLVTEFGIHSLGQRLRLLEELHHLFS